MRNLIRINRALSNLTLGKYQFTTDAPPTEKNNQLNPAYFSRIPKERIDKHFQDVKTINTANKYFLGIELNTDYKLLYSEDSFENIKKSTAIYRIDDVPFSYKQGNLQLSKENRQSKKYEISYLNNLNEKVLQRKMSKLANSYFNDLINFQRKSKLQPNFERYSHRVFRSLSNSGYKFQIVQAEEGFSKNQKQEKIDPIVKINNVHIFKGIKTGRNDNYSLDSYKIIDDESEINNFTSYQLHKRIGQKYPERQWFALQNIMVRFDTSVLCPFFVDITHPNRTITEIGNCVHNFIFEMNLVLPPKFAQFRLSKQQYMKAFRINYEQLLITNVDNKNPFYSLLWSMQQKEKMINKLV